MFKQPFRVCARAFKAPPQMAKRAIEKLLLMFTGVALLIVALIGGEIPLRTSATLLLAPIRAAPKALLLDVFRSDQDRVTHPELISIFRPGVVVTATNEVGEVVEFRTVSLGLSNVGFLNAGLNEEKGFR